MTEGNRIVFSALAGALVGAATGYLFFTDSGRRVRDEIDPKLDEAMREVRRLRGTVGKVQSMASEGWRSLTDLAGDSQP